MKPPGSRTPGEEPARASADRAEEGLLGPAPEGTPITVGILWEICEDLDLPGVTWIRFAKLGDPRGAEESHRLRHRRGGDHLKLDTVRALAIQQRQDPGVRGNPTDKRL